jgi:hypothetical protein
MIIGLRFEQCNQHVCTIYITDSIFIQDSKIENQWRLNITIQGRKWRVGRMGIAHPVFGMLESAAGQRRRAASLLAHPDLGSQLSPCYSIFLCWEHIGQYYMFCKNIFWIWGVQILSGQIKYTVVCILVRMKSFLRFWRNHSYLVQKKMIPHMKAFGVFNKMKQKKKILKKKVQNGRLKKGHFPAQPILNIFLWNFFELVLGLVGLIDAKDIDVA